MIIAQYHLDVSFWHAFLACLSFMHALCASTSQRHVCMGLEQSHPELGYTVSYKQCQARASMVLKVYTAADFEQAHSQQCPAALSDPATAPRHPSSCG